MEDAKDKSRPPLGENSPTMGMPGSFGATDMDF
jgi:hypothetical protein